jgi:hypothetical protein
MATTSLTRYLRLRLSSDLTKDAQYNIARLDLLGATFVTDLAESVLVRSVADVRIEPESSDIGGAGSGGTVTIGHLGEDTATIDLRGTVNASLSLGAKDQATNGTKYLRFKYDSTVKGSPADTGGDRSISFDPNGNDRSIALSGNIDLGGSLTTAGALTTIGAYSISLTFSQAGAFSFPNQASGTLVSRDSTDTLTNKSINAAQNTITNITNAEISSSAAIARSKLASGSADHVLINDNLGVMSSEAQLSKTRGGTGISSTATFPSTGTIATNDNPLTLTYKTFDAEANNLTNIKDVNVKAGAAIALSKLAAVSASKALVSDSSGFVSASTATATEVGYLSGLTSGAQGQLDTKASRALSNLQVSGLAAGDLLVASSGTSVVRLAAGSNGKTLQMVGGTPTWATVSQGAPVVSGSFSTPNSLDDTDPVPVDASASNQTVYVSGNVGPADISAIPQVEAGGVDGQLLRIVGASDTNTVKLEDGDGLALNGYIYLGAGTILQLMWDNDNLVWREVSRNV